MVRTSHWSSEDYKVYTYTCSLQFAIQVHVAQKLEFLNSDQKVVGSTFQIFLKTTAGKFKLYNTFLSHYRTTKFPQYVPCSPMYLL